MKYDVAIIGGGLAGLALANDLAMRGRKVVVFEKVIIPDTKYVVNTFQWNRIRIC
ncbi:MAG: FAD-binding protein [Bacteroidetes bacterium]|nr:FAD-binding protein [Bacteroidota bacterium]